MDTNKLDRFPLNATFELTARCNLQCKMCLIRIDHKRMAELGGRERTTKEWIDMAQEIKNAGTLGLLLTGGEPMLRPDFIQIYREIAQMGFVLTLYTNATLITPEIMKVLHDYPPHRIGITVYGASSDTYERVTGSAKAYYSMLKGVEQLRELPSTIAIRTTCIKDNIKDLDEITLWALNYGVEFNVSRVVTKPVRGGIANVDECRLTPEQNVAMLEHRNIEYIIKPFKHYLDFNPQIMDDMNCDNLFVSVKEEIHTKEEIFASGKRTLYGCSAGMEAYCITWDGKLIGCQMLGDCWTYPFEEGFKKAWDKFPEKVNIPAMPSYCDGCKSACNACPATRFTETGYLNGLPEYLCAESRLACEMEEKLKAEVRKIIEEKGKERYEKICST